MLEVTFGADDRTAGRDEGASYNRCHDVVAEARLIGFVYIHDSLCLSFSISASDKPSNRVNRYSTCVRATQSNSDGCIGTAYLYVLRKRDDVVLVQLDNLIDIYLELLASRGDWVASAVQLLPVKRGFLRQSDEQCSFHSRLCDQSGQCVLVRVLYMRDEVCWR